METKATVGEKIRSLREMKNISLDEMVERTQLSMEQLISIEESGTLPSLAPLIKIARALGVRLGTFLDDAGNNGAVVCRGDERSNGIRFSNDDKSSSKQHMEYFSLSNAKDDRHIEPFVINILPNSEEDYSLSSHEGEEFIFVMEGEVEIVYGKHTYLLKAGDSIHYDSIVKHHVHGFKGQSAKIIAVIYAPL